MPNYTSHQSLNSTIQTPLSKLHSPNPTLQTPLSELNSPNSTLQNYTLQTTLFNYTLPTTLSKLHSPNSTLQIPLYTLHCTRYVLYTLQYSTPNTLQYTLHSTSTLYTLCSPLSYLCSQLSTNNSPLHSFHGRGKSPPLDHTKSHFGHYFAKN